MQTVRLKMMIEVDRVGNGVAIQTPVPLDLVHDSGRWAAVCDSPVVRTADLPSLEAAIIDGAQQVATELQAAVCERPLIAGRVTPEEVSQFFG